MKFVTCLNCIDGRVQLPVINWIMNNYDVDYVDMITEAGMDGILSNKKHSNIDGLLKKIDISLNKHHSSAIFIVGHHDCSGNQVNDKTHKSQIKVAVENIKMICSSAQVIGLWVSSKWTVKKITEK